MQKEYWKEGVSRKGALIWDAKNGTYQNGLKVNRNSPCPCGSGKKYKFCCWSSRKQESSALSKNPQK